MKWRARFAAAGMCMAMATEPAGAQQAVTAQPERSITFDVAVHAGGGKEVPFPLQASDFTVLDNKVPVTPLAFHARKKGDDNVQVVVVVDAINTRAQSMGTVKEQVESFLRANNGALTYPTALAIVSGSGTAMTGFTLNGTRLADVLQEQSIGVRDRDVEFTRGALVDRFLMSTQRLRAMLDSAAARKGRTEVLWVSPGWDYLADPRGLPTDGEERAMFKEIVEFSTLLRTARVTLNTIDTFDASASVERQTYYLDFVKGVKKYTQVESGDLTLQALSIQSGGRVEISNDGALGMRNCLSDLQQYYEITIPQGLAEGPNTYHHLDVKVGERGLTVQTREGYYAQP